MVAQREKSSPPKGTTSVGVRKPDPKPQSDHGNKKSKDKEMIPNVAYLKEASDFLQTSASKEIKFSYGVPFYMPKNRKIKDPRYRQLKASGSYGPTVKDYKLPRELWVYEAYVHLSDYTLSKDCLDYYNSKHGTKFELVQCYGEISKVVSRGRRSHVNFLARKVDADPTEKPVLFFAEMHFETPLYCTILDPSKATKKCNYSWCPPWFAHPIDPYVRDPDRQIIE